MISKLRANFVRLHTKRYGQSQVPGGVYVRLCKPLCRLVLTKKDKEYRRIERVQQTQSESAVSTALYLLKEWNNAKQSDS